MIFQNLTLREKKLLLLFLSCLLCYWVLGSPGIASASNVQRTYTITEAELQALDSRLETLNQISVTQQAESKRLTDTLTKSQAELNQLKNQLNTSTVQLQQAQESLQKANKSFEEYAAEQKRTRLRIKAQRNTWIALAGCLLVALVVK